MWRWCGVRGLCLVFIFEVNQIKREWIDISNSLFKVHLRVLPVGLRISGLQAMSWRQRITDWDASLPSGFVSRSASSPRAYLHMLRVQKAPDHVEMTSTRIHHVAKRVSLRSERSRKRFSVVRRTRTYQHTSYTSFDTSVPLQLRC